MVLELLSGVTATNGKPSGATAGVPVKRIADGQQPEQGFYDDAEKALLLVWDTAGSGTMTVTCRLWGYLVEYTKGGAKVTVARWFPLGTGTDAGKGVINEGVAMGETNTDDIGHAEVVENFGRFDRLYLEVTAIGGTSTAISAVLVGLPSGVKG